MVTNNIADRRSKAPSTGWSHSQRASTVGWPSQQEKHQGYEQYSDL